jgi:hypothetical protein
MQTGRDCRRLCEFSLLTAPLFGTIMHPSLNISYAIIDFCHHARFMRRTCLKLSDCTWNLQGPGKDWESYKTNDNGKVVTVKIPVKKGDTVQCIAGSDKGKVGVIQKVCVSVTSL